MGIPTAILGDQLLLTKCASKEKLLAGDRIGKRKSATRRMELTALQILDCGCGR
jgi:hypothetical protein